MSKAPAIFFGHGSPTNALGGPFADAWRALGARIDKPKGVVMVSAHWQLRVSAVTAMARPKTIHDFYGFPPEMYQIDYPAPGSPALAQRVAQALAPKPVAFDTDGAWGLDHGTWSVLAHVFPEADVPVVQLAIDATQPPQVHYEIGRRLAALRDEGVLIAGSGDVVHNLRLAQLRAGPVPPLDWAVRFNAEVKDAIAQGDHQRLFPGAAMGADAALAIPTDEHWLPLLYVLGAAGAGEAPEFFTDQIEAASVSMLGVGYGIGQARGAMTMPRHAAGS